MLDETGIKLALAGEIAARLARVPDVVAVSLGGSLARGRAPPDSDIDLGLYYRPDRSPELERLREAAAEVGGSAAAVTPFGERRHAQPGHPHGFHAHIYLSEVYYGKVLSDPEGELEQLRERLEQYPPKLKLSLVSSYLWQAQFALDVCEKPAARGESAYVSGCLFESAYCLIQVLYALNERYFINEKGALAEVSTFAFYPPGFTDEVSDVLGHVGESVEALNLSRCRMGRVIDEVRQLSESA